MSGRTLRVGRGGRGEITENSIYKRGQITLKKIINNEQTAYFLIVFRFDLGFIRLMSYLKQPVKYYNLVLLQYDNSTMLISIVLDIQVTKI